MRDSQRQKVYRAESKYSYEAKVATVSFESARDTVGRLAGSFRVKTPKVAVNKRLRISGQYTGYENLIEFSTKTPRVSTVTHEFAHHLFRERVKEKSLYGLRAHGGGFTEAMLDVTEDICGTGDRKLLNSAYIDFNVLVGLDSEVGHVAKNGEKWLRPAPHRDEEGDKVLVVQKTFDDGRTLYFAGRELPYGDFHSQTRRHAYGFRYPKSAYKAGKRLFREGFEVVEADGHYDAYRKHWAPN